MDPVLFGLPPPYVRREVSLTITAFPTDNHPIPPPFARRILDLSGERGRAWLEDLPCLLDDCARRWNVRLGAPFDLSYNYVAPGVRADGTDVVLKAGGPSRELITEGMALEVYAGP